jgi:hypothetical protein
MTGRSPTATPTPTPTPSPRQSPTPPFLAVMQGLVGPEVLSRLLLDALDSSALHTVDQRITGALHAVKVRGPG